MGVFLNRGITEFEGVINSEIYVDKTEIITFFNDIINTEQRYVAVSRPRRFGKSITANMIAAYFEKGSDSEKLFEKYKLADTPNWKKNMNKFNCIRIDIADVQATSGGPQAALDYIEQSVLKELDLAFPSIISRNDKVADALANISDKTKEQFIIIIDEWDAFFRDDKLNNEVQVRYINLLRSLFKGNRSKTFTALAYITGILPIKKYNSESALNNFTEYTMIEPFRLAKYIGFNEDEVKELCKRYDMNFEEAKDWYDGYSLEGAEHIYGPNSVVKAMLGGKFSNYWSQTVAFNSLSTYITMNFEGLKDDILSMLSGNRVKVRTGTYANDMTSFKRKDDVLTCLIHLGYLAYDDKTKEVYIPNKEVQMCFEDTLYDTCWDDVVQMIEESNRLLYATIDGDEEAVAESIDNAHMMNSSIITYNDENSLASSIMLAYYTARNEYNIVRELPTGYGFADIVFIPKKNTDKPAMIIELKWREKAETAIEQIKQNKYDGILKNNGYKGEVLLVGISYEKVRKETTESIHNKEHRCVIEKIEM